MSKKASVVVAILIVLLGLIGFWYLSRRSVRKTPTLPSNPANPPSGNVEPPATTTNPPGGLKEPEISGNSKAPAAEVAPLLRAGENLVYAVNISKLNSTIANITVSVVNQNSVSGKPAWHLQGFAHTENPYRMVFQLDDQFDSYSELAALTSLQYEMHLNERGEKVDSVQRLLPTMKEVPPPGMMGARVLPGTRDPLGLLQYLRNVDWSKAPEVRCPVYDGRKLYDVRSVLVGRSEPVEVPAGKYNASRIEIHVMDNGTEMKDAHFLLYLANDAARTPVLVEAVLPIATARVELTKSH